ncbi:MAG TPA: hypothetical protein VL346_09620 [Acidobacteriaceae bacterium]|nr:hypothetical protein [Acidobacteriaceae bacterium]
MSYFCSKQTWAHPTRIVPAQGSGLALRATIPTLFASSPAQKIMRAQTTAIVAGGAGNGYFA